MKICYVGSLKPKFVMDVNPELDEVIEIKEKILERLGLKKQDDGMGGGQASSNPWMKKIRLFSLKGGLELMNCDLMDGAAGQEYIFYSFGKYFD